MDNGIILLIFWAAINLLLKSSRDKKKAEEAKRRRSTQSKVEGRITPDNLPRNKPKSIIDIFREEIEKEIEKEKKLQQNKHQPVAKPTPNQTLKPTLKPAASTFQTEEIKSAVNIDENKDVELLESIVEEKMEVIRASSISRGSKQNNSQLNLKKDILKGIIYSEILSEPKSLRNLKRY